MKCTLRIRQNVMLQRNLANTLLRIDGKLLSPTNGPLNANAQHQHTGCVAECGKQQVVIVDPTCWHTALSVAVPVCSICVLYLSALSVCSICVLYLCALSVCSICVL